MITQFLCAISPVALVFTIIGCLLGGFGGGYFINSLIISKKRDKSKATAVKIIEDAYAEAKTAKKEAILEAKEEIHKLRTEADKEIKERRLELQKSEDRILQREEFIDNKELSIEKKHEQIEKTKEELSRKEEEVQKIKEEQTSVLNKMYVELENVASMKREEAKQVLMDSMTEEARRDAAKTIRELEQQAIDEANKKAQHIVTLAIQKCATDVTSDTTVSVVALPNDEMKGRIIGREGRNIKALESATGVDLIVDDTPEAITVSSFDPIRREVARASLEKLILDGRIHPTRIEEIVEKVQKDVDAKIKEAGENAIQEVKVYNLHPELVKILGRLKFRTSYGQNCLKHSLETCFIAGLLASELGADVNVAKRGGLLHDIGKALDHEIDGTHVSIGVDLAKKYKENAAVVHCIEAHHFNVEFNSVEAIIVQIADAISSSRPGARRETLETYVKRLEKLEEISNSFKGVEKSFAIQAGREVRIIVKPDEVSDDMAVFMAKDIAKKIEDEMEYPGQIKVNVIRESRFSEYAK